MKLFHHMSTDSYFPISHDNSYLFNHYDRVNNVIRTKLDKKYRNILAKPVQRDYNIEWFSPYNDLKKIDQNKDDFALSAYWKFRKELDLFIDNLTSNSNNDSQNWAELLTKVFSERNNIIFSNGQDISIVWGWEFEENNLYTPKISKEVQDIENEEEKQNSLTVDTPEQTEPPSQESESLPIPDEDDEALAFIHIEEDELIENENDNSENERKSGFLEFLKEFAANYWWLLIVLLAIITIIFLTYLITSIA